MADEATPPASACPFFKQFELARPMPTKVRNFSVALHAARSGHCTDFRPWVACSVASCCTLVSEIGRELFDRVVLVWCTHAAGESEGSEPVDAFRRR